MKRIIVINISVFMLIFFCYIQDIQSQNKQNISPAQKKLVIEGQIQSIPDSIPYIYINLLGKRTDSVKVNNGRYRFVVNSEIPLFITLLCKSPDDLEAYNSNNIITFLAEPTKFSLRSTAHFSNFSIMGSKAYKEYTLLEKRMIPYRQELRLLYSVLKNTEENNKAKKVEIENHIASIRYKMGEEYLKFAQQNKTAKIKLYCISRFSDEMKEEDIFEVSKFYDNFSEIEKSSPEGKNIKSNLRRFEIKIGDKAPQFSMADTSGCQISLSESIDKIVLLDFWASWCYPCRQEIPLLKKLYDNYKSRGFEIVSVSLDSQKDKWIGAIVQDKMNWAQVSDLLGWKNEAVKLYRVYGVPSNFLIDNLGNIIAINIHGAALEKEIKMALERRK